MTETKDPNLGLILNLMLLNWARAANSCPPNFMSDTPFFLPGKWVHKQGVGTTPRDVWSNYEGFEPSGAESKVVSKVGGDTL